jgi:hypothetical protein
MYIVSKQTSFPNASPFINIPLLHDKKAIFLVLFFYISSSFVSRQYKSYSLMLCTRHDPIFLSFGFLGHVFCPLDLTKLWRWYCFVACCMWVTGPDITLYKPGFQNLCLTFSNFAGNYISKIIFSVPVIILGLLR